MLERFVTIDYESLVDHLIARHTVDLPVSCARFELFRSVLEEHLDEIMNIEPDSSDPDAELTTILFKHHLSGEVVSAKVTKVPGIVVFRHGEGIALPRVIIELTHRGF